jgi:hypothetical protein
METAIKRCVRAVRGMLSENWFIGFAGARKERLLAVLDDLMADDNAIDLLAGRLSTAKLMFESDQFIRADE